MKEDAKRWYPDLYSQVSIKIIEPSPELLGNFSQDLKKYVMHRFRSCNIDIINGVSCTAIERFDDHKVKAILSNG